jgi:capsular polysaccharide biosynthesis protein
MVARARTIKKLGELFPKGLTYLADVGGRSFLRSHGIGSKLSRDDVVRLIRASGAFDETFYKATYQDVREAGADPISHWVDFGAREGRDPSDPRNPNPEVYRLLERHRPDTRRPTESSGKSLEWRKKSSRPERRAPILPLRFSPLQRSDAATQYSELAPEVRSAPIPPSFVLGPFPELLTQTYFADVTALSVGCYTLNDVGVTSHGLLVRKGALLTCEQLNLSEGIIKQTSCDGNILAESDFSRMIDEPIVCLVGPGHMVYGHWLVDFLPRLYILKQNGINPLTTKYLIPANTPKFALSLLTLLGISEHQLVFFEPYAEVVGAACLIVPTLLRTNSRTHPLFRPAIEYVLSLIRREGNRAYEGEAGRRLYVTRGGSGPENRKLLNRQAIEKIAADRGYALVRPETLSMVDQMNMFSRAESIVGEYGSALHGSLFAPSKTVVCALRATAHHPGFLQSGLCQAMGQKIGYVFGAAGWHDVEQEFSIPEDDFKTALTLVDMHRTD